MDTFVTIVVFKSFKFPTVHIGELWSMYTLSAVLCLYNISKFGCLHTSMHPFSCLTLLWDANTFGETRNSTFGHGYRFLSFLMVTNN